MSQINKGVVTITLNDTEYNLTPSLDCFTKIALAHESYRDCMNLIMKGHVKTVVHVLRLGLQWSGAKADKLPEMVWKNGLDAELLNQIATFVFQMFNGGKSIDDVLKVEEQGSEKGEQVFNEGKSALLDD